MTQKKRDRINRLTAHGSEYPAGRYNFVFSERIEDWMGAKTQENATRRHGKKIS